jgi:hypothetical protein
MLKSFRMMAFDALMSVVASKNHIMTLPMMLVTPSIRRERESKGVMGDSVSREKTKPRSAGATNWERSTDLRVFAEQKTPRARGFLFGRQAAVYSLALCM